MFWYARKNSALWCRDQQRNSANVGMGLNTCSLLLVRYLPARCREQRCCHHQPSHSHYLAEVTWQVVAVKPNKVSPRLNVQLQVHVLSPRPAPAPTQGDLGSLEPLEPGHWWPSAAALSRSSLLIKWSSPPVHLQDCARYNYNYRHGGHLPHTIILMICCPNKSVQ